MKSQYILIFTTILIIMILFSGCLTFPVEERLNNVDKIWYNETYGEDTYIDVYFTLWKTWDETITIQRNAIKAKKHIKEETRQRALEELETFKHTENAALSFAITAENELPVGALNLKFVLNDAEGTDLTGKFMMFHYVNQFIIGDEVKSSSYVYHWLIQTTQPIIEEKFGENRVPVILTVTFPNQQTREYSVKPQ